MSDTFLPYLWVAITLPVLLFMQRRIHLSLQNLTYSIIGNEQWALMIYAIILLPGVFLHELSHYITAGLLGIRTGRFSVFPKPMNDGTVRMGYVEYFRDNRLGSLRESLVGVAPLIWGTVVVLLIGYKVFDLTQVMTLIRQWEVESLRQAFAIIRGTNDSVLWLYLLFAVSNAMMPSPSDRRAWPRLLLIMAVIVVVMFLLDLQPMMMQGITGPLATLFTYLALAFSMTIILDIVMLLIFGTLNGVLRLFRH